MVRIWPRVESILRRVVIPESGWTLDHLLTALQLGKMQMFVVGDFDAVVVLSVNSLPLHKVLWIEFIAGSNMSEWLDDWKAVQDDVARHYGCKYIEFRGRKGWNRLNKHHPDFEAIQTIFRKEI